MKARLPILTLILGLLVFVGACSSAPEAAPTPTAEPVPTQAQATQTPVPTPSEEEVLTDAKPTPKQGLVATDPTTVDLASGGPKLVEFFAFW
ncbi:MAG: hypothetical protein PVF85_09890 [Anaerolineales bacterium]